MTKNMLYLGMADDIMAPLLIEPNVDHIYVISEFDACFSPDGTIEGQMNDIKKILTQGNDLNTSMYKVRVEYDYRRKPNKELYKKPHYLRTKSKILSESLKDNVWELFFEYDGKIRRLKYYQHRNFFEEWPEDVTELDYVISIGAFIFDSRPGYTRENAEMIYKMLNKRTKSKFKTSFLFDSHKLPTEKKYMLIQHGKQRNGSVIDIVEINRKKDLEKIKKAKEEQFKITMEKIKAEKKLYKINKN